MFIMQKNAMRVKRVWTIFLMCMMVFPVWAVCTDISKENFDLNTIASHEIDLGGRSYCYITFQAKRSVLGKGEMKLAQLVNGQWSAPIWSANPGKVVDKSILGIEKEVDYVTYECALSPQATQIKFYTEMGATLKKYVRNMVLTYQPTFVVAQNELSFAAVKIGEKSTATIDITYAALTENSTALISGTVFSIENRDALPQKDVCDLTTTTLRIAFQPNAWGAYDEILTLSDGSTIRLYGECTDDIQTTLSHSDVGFTTARLAWMPVNGATAYRLVDQLSGTVYTAPGDAVQMTLTGLKMGTSYCFVLYALLNGVTSLNASNEAAFVTQKRDVELKDCVVFQSDAEQSYLVHISYENYITYQLPSDVSAYTKRLEFEVKTSSSIAYVDKDGDMGVYVLLRGESNYRKINNWSGASAGINENYQKQVVEIPYNTVSIKFTNETWNGSLSRYVRNVKVFKDNVLWVNGDALEENVMDFGEVEFGEEVSKEVTVTYSNASVLLYNADSKYYQIEEIDPKNACDEGVVTLKVTFYPYDCEDDYTAVLSLFNGQEVALTLKGQVKKTPTTVNLITWSGAVSSEWDNRDNWVKSDGSVLTCHDVLSEQLEVVIPALNGEMKRYPILPDLSTDEHFVANRTAKWNGKQVNAGGNEGATKIASKIKLEYGASLVGVEKLNASGVDRYDEAEVAFVARRNTWLLAGAVVRPWQIDTEDKIVVVDGKKQTRLACSRDYYRWHLPQVYMHKAIIDPTTNKATWGVEFPDLDVDLPQDSAYAIYIPNEYGPDYLPASSYNYTYGTHYDSQEAIHYTFTGRFYNESELPSYTVKPEQPVMLTNTYPANIDAVKMAQAKKGTVQFYSYNDQSFNTVDAYTKEAVIQAQHSFVFTPAAGVEQLDIEKDWLLNTEVTHRSTEVEMPYVRVEMRNASKNTASNVCIIYNPEKADVSDLSVDAPKVFNGMNRSLPDLYVMRYNAKWAGVHIPSMIQSIPLGVNVSQKNQSFTFGLMHSNIEGQILLEDRLTETITDLSTHTYSVGDLPVGVCEGRFYLSIVPTEDEDYVPDDLPTSIIEEDAGTHQIGIYANGNNVTVTTNEGNDLQSIVVTDMAGRIRVYNVSGRYVNLSLPIATGVYTLRVVADNAVRTEKIYLSK